MDWTLLAIPGAALLRNIAGWLENSLKDGTINGYEWGQLGKTILEVAVISVAVMYGLNLDPVQASGVGLLGSIGISAVKKAGTS